MSEEKDTVEVPRSQLQAWIDEIRRLRAAAPNGTAASGSQEPPSA